MKTRIFQGLLIIALLVPAFGCPPGPPKVSPGVWVFALTRSDSPGSTLGALVLNADGTTETPVPLPPATTSFSGTLTWVQNGSTVTMNQVSGADTFQYTGGIVDSSTLIFGGAWMQTAGGAVSGGWRAEKLP